MARSLPAAGPQKTHSNRRGASAHVGKTAIYARVSSSDQKPDLDRQVARVTTWATSNGHSIDSVVTEVWSTLNGKRRKFLALLWDPEVTTIVVEDRDRFARFGAEYVAAALDANHRRMAVVADAEVDDDLVRDMTELMTSLCARLYGRRSAKNRAEKALLCAAHNVGPMALSRPDGTMSS